MTELLKNIAAGLVDDKSAIEVTQDEPNEEGVIVFHLHVAPDDMGRVKQPTLCEPPFSPGPPVKSP